jgi:plasmid stabilization system protein ParE
VDQNSPATAEAFGNALLNHIGLLRTFPYIGSPVAGKFGIRQVVPTPILIYYCVQENPRTVEILHFGMRPEAARDFESESRADSHPEAAKRAATCRQQHSPRPCRAL